MNYRIREEKIRSFIAFDLDDPEMLLRIEGVQRELLSTESRITVVHPENLHVTMSFLGEIPERTVDHIITELQQVEFTPFQLSVRGVGAFPNLRRINVIWVGLEKGSEELGEIFKLLRRGLARAGLAKRSERFSPHITIARVKSRRNIQSLSGKLLSLQDTEFGETLLDTLRLKRSVLTPNGPVYTTIAEKKAKQTG